MRLLRKILFPFSLIYSGITSIRNKMYDLGILKSSTFDLPVICVGNLSVGGTGKSPMIEYLISLLKDEFAVATLSRGYKRETSGFYLLQGTELAKAVGDEPLQFKSKFPEVAVAVDEQRKRGIEELQKVKPRPEVILLDDAFQHRKVKAGLNILLSSYGKLYSEDQVLPTGNLREPRSGAARAQLVVITKCPVDLSQPEKERIRRRLRLKQQQQLFFSGIAYGGKVYNESSEMGLQKLAGQKFSLVTGIANPQPLVDYLNTQDLEFDHLSYPDHHNFSKKEIEALRELPFVLTTEKDFMRLKGVLEAGKLFYLPMEMKFLCAEEQEEFDRTIQRFSRGSVIGAE